MRLKELSTSKAAEWSRRYRERHPEKKVEMLQRNRAWAKAHPEKKKESNRRFYLLHKEEYLLGVRQYREKHPEMARTWTRNWRLAHPEEAKARVLAWNRKNYDRIEVHRILFKALKRGEIVRPEIGVCGHPGQPQGFHKDFNKPLEVEWICHRCLMRRYRSKEGA